MRRILHVYRHYKISTNAMKEAELACRVLVLVLEGVGIMKQGLQVV